MSSLSGLVGAIDRTVESIPWWLTTGLGFLMLVLACVEAWVIGSAFIHVAVRIALGLVLIGTGYLIWKHEMRDIQELKA